MNLVCDTEVAVNYGNPSQISRLISEHWIRSNAYCLDCDSSTLTQTKPNTPSVDFVCARCGHTYELKSFRSRPGKSLINGAYGRLMSQIERNAAPTLMLLQRDEQWRVRHLSAVHSVFVTNRVVEPRRPLASTARRAGWIGCNIRLDRMPQEAEVMIVENFAITPPEKVREAFQRFSPMRALSSSERSWTSLTLSSLRGLRSETFTLQDFYQMEPTFAIAYPGNQNVRAKMRQQLQRLRDLGSIAFEGRGRYRLLS